ncbi:hypothetical protein [Sediminitomix flava]|uniref:SH3 domain-containing protein n=1 Tax=Sediminitomix flava TaxID=379075 RepID=A0A315ZAZ2_SEDFL|nr:hypothetical protein [Sediminitomix flava]PWJ41988.1 hypothetical protein BC781_103238 [Sediminitomix flava]
MELNENSSDWRLITSNISSVDSINELYISRFEHQKDIQLEFEDEIQTESGYAFSLNNIEEKGIFQFMKTKISELTPETPYIIDIEVSFATQTLDTLIHSQNDFNVEVNLGYLLYEPNLIEESKTFKQNFELSATNNVGSSTSLGFYNIDKLPYSTPTLHKIKSDDILTIRSDENGEFWLWIGYQSDIKGHQGFFINQLSIFYELAE